MHTELQEFTRRLVQVVVDHPEAVEVRATPMDGGAYLIIRVAPGEVGMVIGKHGRMIQAIRQIVMAHGMQLTLRVRVDIEEPDGSVRR